MEVAQWCFRVVLIAIRGIMICEDTTKILDENLWLSAQNLDLGHQFTLQQDNHPKHTSKSVTVCLQKKKKSPDMKPIKNLWQKLKVWINHQSTKSRQELEHVTIEEWKVIPKKTCSNLTKNFRKWLQQVITIRCYTIGYYCENCSVFFIFHTVQIILSFPLFLFFFSYLANLTYPPQN